MKQILAMGVVLGGVMLTGGCATKKYVQNTTAPIQTKVDELSATTTKQGGSIEQSQKEIERHETAINAAKERAMSAESKAGDAMNKANQADQNAQNARGMAEKNGQQISSLEQKLGSIDDYKPVADLVVPFGFNKWKLTKTTKEQLDQFASQYGNLKRFYVTVEGFTDKTGTADYNEQLSKRRADQVVEYLVAKHNLPLYRVQVVGLGKENPVETGNRRADRAKNRRVEVKIYSADQNVAMTTQPASANQATDTNSPAAQGAQERSRAQQPDQQHQ